jgi:hypothetical protein
MNSLTQLQQRRAALKGRIDQQQVELKRTFQELREEIEPSFLLKKALAGLFDSRKGRGSGTSNNFLNKFPVPVSYLVDLFVKNQAVASLLKMFAPMALSYLQNRMNTSHDEKPGSTKLNANIYGSLRHGVASLRKQLNAAKNTTAVSPEP